MEVNLPRAQATGNSPPRLRIVTGKGGVGKTIVATVLAMAEARRRRRVLLAEINGRDSVARLLGAPPVGATLRELTEGFFAVDINPHDAMHEYALLVLRFESVYRAVFENRLVQRFLRLVPSLNELTMLGKIGYHEQQQQGGQPRFDVIVVDAPATGHGIALLRAAQVVQQTVPAGPLRDNAAAIHALLTDPIKTRLHVVTTPHEMAVTETLELARVMTEEIGITLGSTFVNQLVDPLPAETLAALDEQARGGANAEVAAKLVQALRDRQEHCEEGNQQLRRLPADMLAGSCRLPRLVTNTFGLEELQCLAGLAATALEREGDAS